MIEHTGQAFFAYDTSINRFTYLSQEVGSFFDVQELQAKARNLMELVHREDRDHVLEAYKELQPHGIHKAVEFRLQFPGKEEQWVCLHVHVLNQTQEGQLIIGHAQDITAQRKYIDFLEKTSSKKNAILNIISHDLAGPFANIQSLSELLTHHLQDERNPEVHELISLIEQSSKQGAQLIREFLNQEFLESSKVDLVKRRVTLVTRLRKMLEEYQGQKSKFISKRIEFFANREEIHVKVDYSKFIQVINNLISNALKFTPDGGVITVSLEEQDESVLVKVADTGIGIPEKYHDSLFDPFTHARRPGLKGESSVGLGMSIIKTIVEWHKGEIWFQSQQNKGTTFFINLPKE